MSLSIVFIRKSDLRVVEALPWPVEGGVTPNQLPHLRERADEDGNTWIEYGRYSEHGFCSQPYDEILEAELWR